MANKKSNSDLSPKLQRLLNRNKGCMCNDCKAERQARRRTSIENILVDKLLKEFPVVQREKQFGPYRIDAYLPPPYHLAMESDGSYWHSKPGAKEFDEKRDKFLLEKFGLIVIRFTEEELREIDNYGKRQRGNLQRRPRK